MPTRLTKMSWRNLDLQPHESAPIVPSMTDCGSWGRWGTAVESLVALTGDADLWAIDPPMCESLAVHGAQCAECESFASELVAN